MSKLITVLRKNLIYPDFLFEKTKVRQKTNPDLVVGISYDGQLTI